VAFIINNLILKTKEGKKMKKKVFVLIMILATLLVFSLGTALAGDAILFPYWISGGGYATFIQIVNMATVDTPITGTNEGKLHYVYVYNSDTETCQHYDNVGKTTQNDILLYEVTKQFYQGTSNEQLLPGDTTSTSPTLSSSPKWGYLVVEHNEDNFDTAISDEGTLFGQEYVVNLNTGTIWANNAVNDPTENTLTCDPSGCTCCHGAFNYSVYNQSRISWLPEQYASTMWYFFPVNGYDLTDSDPEYGIVWNSVLTVGYEDNGIYDNNESRKSGTKHLMIGCWNAPSFDQNLLPVNEGAGPITANFFYSLKELLTGEQYAATANSGGWCDAFNDGDGYGGSEVFGYDALYVYKLQSTEILGKPMDTILFEPQEYPTDSYTK
jgi:hypothetical protein